MLKIHRRKSGVLTKVLNETVIDLATPINITVFWNFGRILGLVLGMQLMTGLFLAMHYTADITMAFSSVSHIIRDVNGGWFLRSLHANGASFFFLCIYAHIGRGLYYGSHTYKGTWLTGVILLFLVIASAFLGYVLPWGQIRFWGATVITNLFRAFPYLGPEIVTWLWGGFSVDNPTLTRFFTFHFIIPILIAALVLIHICLLHRTGSNNPLGVSSNTDKVPFHWYFAIKDMVGFVVLVAILTSLTLFTPNLLGEPDNYILANPLTTPAHIVPEWYFLFAYAILRSVPNKLGGVVGLFASLLFLITIPYLNKNTLKRNAFYPPRKILHWVLVVSFIILTVAGRWPVEEPYIITSRIFALFYFSFFVLNLPLRLLVDRYMRLSLPSRQHTLVLGTMIKMSVISFLFLFLSLTMKKHYLTVLLILEMLCLIILVVLVLANIEGFLRLFVICIGACECAVGLGSMIGGSRVRKWQQLSL